MDVGSNPVNTFLLLSSSFFFLEFFSSQLVFNVPCIICMETFFLFFPSCSMLYLLSPRRCFFLVFTLDFINILRGTRNLSLVLIRFLLFDGKQKNDVTQ